MSEPELGTTDEYVNPTSDSIPVPPPRKKARRKRAQYTRIAPPPLTPPIVMPPRPTVTMEQILAAKAILQQAEAALGVAHEVKKDAPVPLHPQSLEEPSQGDKTPEVVEWYHKNAPEEYKRRYAGRKTHLEDRRKERPYVPLPAGANPATFPADPDGIKLSQTDDSGRAPRNFRDL